MPCQKLAAKFGGADVGKRMTADWRTAFYLSVVREGEVATGDSIELFHRHENSIKVSDAVLLHTAEKANRVLLQRTIDTDALSEAWRAIRRKLAGPGR
jgi:MOSC domain-containing protein YiiM